jgi:hypothetical protein
MNRSSGDTSLPLVRMSAKKPRLREVRMRFVAQARFLRSSERSMALERGAGPEPAALISVLRNGERRVIDSLK